jgi:hypothetical protein
MCEQVEQLAELEPEAITVDGYDDALVGWTDSWQGHERLVRAVYSVEKILATMKSQGMSHEEAEEFFEFNIAGAYVGKHTPVFVRELV